MEKITINTLEVIKITRKNGAEFFIHGPIHNSVNETDTFDELFDLFAVNNASPLAFRVFTSDTIRKRILQSHAKSFSELACPITWISQNERPHKDALSIQVQAFSGSIVETLKHDNTTVGCRYSDEDADYVQLSLLPGDLSDGNYQQAVSAFEKCRKILVDTGLDFENVARTWLFTHDILSWYNELNLARDNFFNHYNIFNKLIPASTGVGVANPAGAWLAFEAFAVNPKNDNVLIQKVDSPLQCPALDYGSSFSRATHIQTSSHRRLLVSGTASIDPDGKTVYINDTAKQIDKTMGITRAVLKKANMDWQNIVRGIMYFKDAREFTLFDDWCNTNNVTIPHVKVHGDICRDDLLFEMEIDGIISK